MKVSSTVTTMANPSKWLDPNTWKVSKVVGITKGPKAIAVSTVILEFVTQGIEKYIGSKSPFVRNIMDKQFQTVNQVSSKLPTNISKTLDVRDLIVLAQTITSAIKIFTDKSSGGKKNRAIDALTGLATKGALRMTGLNPSLLSKGSMSPQNPRVTVGGGLTTNNGVYP